MSNVWTGPEPEPEPEEEDENALESTTFLYHDAIRSSMQQQTVKIEPALNTNRNCSVDIYNLPEGTTMSEVLAAIAHHRPVGLIYKCELLQAMSPAGSSPAPSVARIRFKSPDSASFLFQIANQIDLGLYVKGRKVGVRFTRLSTSAYTAEGTRVVIFRGPNYLVNSHNLKRVFGGGKFVLEQMEMVTPGPVGLGGMQEVEWRFFEFAWGAQVAKCLFDNAYGRRVDCSARYGVDPCA